MFKYVLASLILIPAIVASFLSYELIVSEEMIQTFVDQASPIEKSSYRVDSVDISLSPDVVNAKFDGEILFKNGVMFDADANTGVDYRDGKFYLTNIKLNSITYDFNSSADEAMVKGGVQAASSWLKSKIKESDMDEAYKEELDKEINMHMDNMKEYADNVVQSVTIPVYEMENAPLSVRILGAFIEDLRIGDGELTVVYSPRIMWIWVLSIIIAVAIAFSAPESLFLFAIFDIFS